MSLNKVMLIGNVGSEPSVRYLEGNTKVASFSLATSERYKDRNGENKENTEWHNIVVWRNLADFVEKYIHKGSQLFIEGKIRTRNYTDQANVKKYITEIVADSIQFVGRKGDDASAQSVPSAGPQYEAPQYSAPQYAAPQPSASSPSKVQPSAAEMPQQVYSGPQDIDGEPDDLPF